ncbi:MAG: Flp family type IVb pilin [Deltaproteobacteria bacterium]|nr:MAG: Flp family type IVb pilin [Deltaproteobacteria bacterium]
MIAVAKDLIRDESGVTAIEYGLIAGLMAALLLVVLGTFGDKLKGLFNAIADTLQNATDTVQQQNP